MSKSHDFSKVFHNQWKCWLLLTFTPRQTEHKEPVTAGCGQRALDAEKTSFFSKPENVDIHATSKVVPVTNTIRPVTLIPVTAIGLANPGREITLRLKKELNQRMQGAVNTCEYCVSYSVFIQGSRWLSVYAYRVNNTHLAIYQIYHLTTPPTSNWSFFSIGTKTPDAVARMPLILIRKLLDQNLGQNTYHLTSR